MHPRKAEELLARASRPTLERLREDHQRAPAALKPLFVYIEEHLFDVDLNVTQARQACGKRDNSTGSFFHRAVGVPPSIYIAERRLETAARLLRNTRLPVWQVGALTGFKWQAMFSRRFKAWWGETPTRFRKSQQRVSSEEFEKHLLNVEKLRQALAGELAEDEARRLLEMLRSIYRAEDGGPERPVEPGETLEQFEDDEAWERLKGWRWSDPEELVQARLRFAAPALFHLLRQRSLEVGRTNRRRALELAEVAVESINLIEAALGEALPGLQAQADDLGRHLQTGGEEAFDVAS